MGSLLLEEVTKLTGLPENLVRKELEIILKQKNIDPDNLTLDQLRVVVSAYLRQVMKAIKSASASK